MALCLRAVVQSRHWEPLVGSELYPSGLAVARKRLPVLVEFVQMDARNIPAEDVFDLTGDVRLKSAQPAQHGLVIRDVLDHIKCATSLALEPCRRHRLPPTPHQRGELEAKLRCNGEVLFSTSYTAVLLPLMVLSRLSAKHKDGNEEVAREFELNRMFTAILRSEVRMTLSGLRWPAGGSRFVVAREV